MTDRSRKGRLRCAIYTRKSSEEGLEQDFNSLDAQREACAAYIASQKHEGWVPLPAPYDDGGYSGGTMDRPALTRLLDDIASRRIDVVVVYKVDRLTRALNDFARIVEVFDGHGVSFVSVTQQFNTTTSMGRLTLNVLLSFAQFEREVTGERIRDKIAASKKKGLWMGGYVPFGYRADGRTLVIEPGEAEIVRQVFTLYLEHGSVRQLEAALESSAITVPKRTTKSGRVYGAEHFSRGQLYKMLSNPIYCGEIRHRDERFPGQHPAIIAPDVFADVAARLAGNTHDRRTGRNSRSPSLLAGLLVDADGETLVATHATKAGTRYRYYVSRALHVDKRPGRPRAADDSRHRGWRLAASAIEPVVVDELRSLFGDEAALLNRVGKLLAASTLSIDQRTRCAEAGRRLANDLACADPSIVRAALLCIVERIQLSSDSLAIHFAADGLAGILGMDRNALTADHEDLRLVIPVSLRRRGIETRLIVERDDRRNAVPDETLIRALARARHWMRDLMEGTHRTVSALASAYGTNPHYVARHMPLACLAPSIIEAVLDGRPLLVQGAHGKSELTTWDLLNRIEIPLDWDRQRHALDMNV